MMTLLRLYWEFFKTGLFAIGGGMATLPFLKDIGETTGWYSYGDLMNMLAVSESTPGPIGINMATYVGFTVAGIPGAVVATLGVVFPSLVIISILAGLITNFSHLTWVQNAFAGIQVCVCVLIFNSVRKLLKKSVVDKRTAVIFIIVMLCSTLLNVSPVWFVVISALAGIVLKELEAKEK